MADTAQPETAAAEPAAAPRNPAALAAEARLQAAVVGDEAHAQGTHLLGPLDIVVQEGKQKFHTALEDELLDWKRNNPMQVEACAQTLIRIFTNILEHPEEDKYKKVKATSNAFKTVTNIKGGEHLIVLAGFKPQVVDLVKYWTFTDGPPGSHKHAILQECNKLLERAITLIHEKAERKRLEAEEKVAAEKARLAAIKAALDEDKAYRRQRNEFMSHANAAQQASTAAQPASQPMGDAAASREAEA